jgi:hypothetical protein
MQADYQIGHIMSRLRRGHRGRNSAADKIPGDRRGTDHAHARWGPVGTPSMVSSATPPVVHNTEELRAGRASQKAGVHA